jgi:putative ABC transport system permease protein
MNSRFTAILVTFEAAAQLAWGAITRQRRRTILTMLGVAIGVGAVITIQGAGAGIQAFVLGQLDAFGPDSMSIETRVPVGKKSNLGGGPGSVGITITTLKQEDLDTIMRNPNVSAAYGMVMGQEAVSYNGEIKKVMLMGNGYQEPLIEKMPFSEGDFYTQGDEESLAQVAVLGSKAKEKLFGDAPALDKIIYIRGKAFRVVGVLEPRGAAFFFDMDNIILLPAKTMQRKLLGIDYFQQIIARMKDGSKGEQTALELTEDIRINHDITDPDRDDFIVNTTADAQKILTTVTGGITLLLTALVCISLIVGGVGIMNIMYVSVAERTFEIGLRKSLGAERRDILWQFLTEAVLITVGGGLVGVMIGATLAFGIYAVATSLGFKWVYSISLASVFFSVIFSAGIGILFGLYPARQAAGLNPIEALRKE